jgi:hypothetical protein
MKQLIASLCLSFVTGKTVVNEISEILGSDYMQLNHKQCFAYDDSLGSYSQTVEMLPLNSLFETTIDISDVKEGGVAQITLHRNSYSSVAAKEQNQMAISLVFDKIKSDKYLNKNGLNALTSAMMYLEVIGRNGKSVTNIGSVKNADLKNIKISIDFKLSSKAIVMVNS